MITRRYALVTYGVEPCDHKASSGDSRSRRKQRGLKIIEIQRLGVYDTLLPALSSLRTSLSDSLAKKICLFACLS